MTQSATVLRELLVGNARFVAGTPLHPHQDVDRRAHLSASQAPIVAIFGCSDSRLAAEIIFDLGLGDAFVIRNAGQVVSESVLGSLEYAVAVLHVPLVVVLGHDSCGAVAAAIDAQSAHPPLLPDHIRTLIAPIGSAVRRVAASTVDIDPAEVGREHLRDTVTEIIERSTVIQAAVGAGELAVVGANYKLAEGAVAPDRVVGLLDVDAPRNHEAA